MGLFLGTVGQFKSPLPEVARGLLRSRSNQTHRAERLAEQLREQREISSRLEKESRDAHQKLAIVRQRLAAAERENQRLKSLPFALPDDPPLPNHSYGARMMSLCIELAKRTGFHACVDVLKIVFGWLGIESKIPSWTCVRMWLCRMGVDGLNQSLKPQDDWIWLADHSNQIGKEKVLTILGIRSSELPAPGQTLRHRDVHVLAVVPGTQWKRDDVREQYRALAAKIGRPRMLISDGAVELRESADVLENPEKPLILLRDMKHFAANALDRMLSGNDRFESYLSRLGRTRSAIQQTELSHFTPPAPKLKARFMNLESTLRWGVMVSWHLGYPRSEARQGISAERMNEKLGWLRQYRADLARWNRLQMVINESLRFINTHGLYRGASADLGFCLDRLRADQWERCEASDEMARTLIEFVADSEQQLAEGERGWLSTEILESSFGLYKGLEGQHSKGGFTSLLAGFAALLSTCTPERVREGFRRVSVQDVNEWVSDNLGRTLSSKRARAYRESAPLAPISINPG